MNAASASAPIPLDGPINADMVFAAAHAILKVGKRPTIERVRAALGRGSPNTIGKHLEAWYAALAQQLDGEAGPPAVDGVPASVRQLARELWTAALAAAHAQAAEERRAGQQALEASARDLEEQRCALAARAEELTRASDQASAAYAAAQDRLQALREQLGRGDVLRQTAEAAAAASQHTADTAVAELEALRAQHAADLAGARAEQDAERRRAAREIDLARAGEKAAKERFDRLEREFVALRERVQAAETALAAQAARHTAVQALLTGERDEATRAVAQLREQLLATQRQLDASNEARVHEAKQALEQWNKFMALEQRTRARAQRRRLVKTTP